MELAINKELNKEYINAVELYEEEMNNTTLSAPLESYINLAFLYWSFAFDFFGFDIPNSIPDNYTVIGGNRYPKILELGLNNYPNSIELNFWLRYFSHIIYSEEFSESDCQRLIEKYGDDKSLIPYFFLYLFNKNKYEVQRDKLLEECSKQATAKNIYITSILKSK